MNDVAWHTVETMGHRSQLDDALIVDASLLFDFVDKLYGRVADNHPELGVGSPWTTPTVPSCSGYDGKVPPTHILKRSLPAWEMRIADLLASGLTLGLLDGGHPSAWQWVEECSSSCAESRSNPNRYYARVMQTMPDGSVLVGPL